MRADVEPSAGWEILSDHDLLHFWETWRPRYEAQGIDPNEVEGFQNELKRRGWRIDDCPVCHHKRIRQLHDYKCIICRELEER